MVSFPGKGGDTNDGGNYRYYIVPQTGEIAVLLPQIIQTTVTNAFYRIEDENNALVLPPELDGAVFLGIGSLDEDATNFTYSSSSGPWGRLAGESQGTSTFFTYAADNTARDALTATQITEGGVVGVGVGDGYAEYRVCLLYTSPSPRDKRQSRMPSSA